MNDSIEQKRVGKYLIQIFQDEDPSDPRGDDNVGVMVCFHRHYSLGDKHDISFNDFDSWSKMEKFLTKEKKAAVILPLYLYDHSGITMNTTGFSCRWDSGRVGLIYVTKERIMEEWGGKNKILTPALKARAKTYLEGEVETYDKFLTGEIYGYQVHEIQVCDHGHEHKEYLDSCWGFYDKDECMAEAEGIVEYEKEKENKSLKTENV